MAETTLSPVERAIRAYNLNNIAVPPDARRKLQLMTHYALDLLATHWEKRAEESILDDADLIRRWNATHRPRQPAVRDGVIMVHEYRYHGAFASD